MKKHIISPLLSRLAMFFLTFLLCNSPVYATEADALSEITAISPEDTEFDHYAAEDGIQPYASSLTGDLNNIVIFIRFADDEEYITADRIQNAERIFNTGSLSFKDYMSRISYGQIKINTTFYPRNPDGYYSIQVSQPADYYKSKYTNENGEETDGYANENERRQREEELIREAADGVKDQLASCGLALDNNSDGIVDAVSFIVSIVNPYTEHVNHGDLLWAHKSSLTGDVELVDGLKIKSYNLINRGTDNTGVLGANGELARTVKHEFLHTLSMPDLYRYNDSSAQPLGPWDIMDTGNAANITGWYQREYLEFGASLPVYTASAQGVTLRAAQYTDPNEIYAIILKSPFNEKESFVVEYRKKEDGCASQLNSGLLVYRIVDPVINAPIGNSGGPPDFIYAFRPGETGLNTGDGQIEYATLSPDNPKGFTSLGKSIGMENPDYDNGTIYYTDGSNSGIIIDNLVRGSDDSMTFDITFPEEIKGNGTNDSPYEIYTAQDLYMLGASSANTYYRLMNDIDLNNFNYTPILQFKGILDGNNKTIKNLNVSQQRATGFIIDVLESAVIKNISFAEPVITSANDYASIFSNVQGILDNIRIDGGTITSQIGGFSSRAGGLAGALNSPGRIQNCYTSANVSANCAGGLVSYLTGGTITDSYACGRIGGLGSNSVTGGIFAYCSRENPSTASGVYWSIPETGQTANGRFWEDNTSAELRGSIGLQLECPDSASKGSSYVARLISPSNGTFALTTKWKSSDPSILTIDTSTGSISVQKSGNADISCTFIIGGHTGILHKSISCQGTTGENKPSGGNQSPDENVPSTPESVLLGNWITSNGKWWFRKQDGSYPANGLFTINGSLFAFDASGWMITGWYQTNGHWYYFDNNGYMKKGWLHLGRTWYYLSPSNGQMYANGVYSIGNSTYAFKGSGAMVTGWHHANGHWYYFNSSGYMQKGWLHLGNTWYYLNPSTGQMYANAIYPIGNSTFAFNSSGAMITGWHLRNGYWYYFNSNGYMQKGWLHLGNTWYYLNPSNGRMYANGTMLINGRPSSFSSSGTWLGYAD